MKTFPDGFFIKIKSKLQDNSELIIREYSDSTNREYSYHWQSDNKTIRWDNSPHHKTLKTFPHHKHVGCSVLPSTEISVEDVLAFLAIEINSEKF